MTCIDLVHYQPQKEGEVTEQQMWGNIAVPFCLVTSVLNNSDFYF
jgi:hypothetical protein